MRTGLVVTAIVVALSGCASSPDLDYYTLDMRPTGGVEAGVNLRVGRFVTTEKLDRTQIVIHETPTRIDYYARQRWATGVGEMVQQKLEVELGPFVDGRRALWVAGRVLAFEQVDSATGPPMGRVRLEVEIRDATAQRYQTPLLEKTYDATRPADENSVDAVVRALSAAVADIAAEIAADAAVLPDQG